MENGFNLIGGSPLAPASNNTQTSGDNSDVQESNAQDNASTPQASDQSASSQDSPATDNANAQNSDQTATSSEASTTNTSRVETFATTTGQTAVVAKLDLSASTDTATASDSDMLERLARERALLAIAEAKELAVVEMLKSPPLAVTQVVSLYSEAPTNKAEATYKVKPAEEL